MACGIAVVGADVPGIREAIQHGQTGWLCPSSPEEIREAIQYLLEHHDLRAALSRNARQFIEDNLSLQRIAELELNTIMEVIHAAQR
jgi:glycosyltransferase involved in cell wall biosynthesis